MGVRARVYFHCKHEGDEIQLRIGPHSIEENGDCGHCIDAVDAFFKAIPLAMNPGYISSLIKIQRQLRASFGLNLILFTLIFIMLIKDHLLV